MTPIGTPRGNRHALHEGGVPADRRGDLSARETESADGRQISPANTHGRDQRVRERGDGKQDDDGCDQAQLRLDAVEVADVSLRPGEADDTTEVGSQLGDCSCDIGSRGKLHENVLGNLGRVDPVEQTVGDHASSSAVALVSPVVVDDDAADEL